MPPSNYHVRTDVAPHRRLLSEALPRTRSFACCRRAVWLRPSPRGRFAAAYILLVLLEVSGAAGQD
jgi:hypothetical protein